MSEALKKALQNLTGQSGDDGFIVEGDEWWLNPEFQPERETREEWKARNFSRHYGRRPTTLASLREKTDAISEEEEMKERVEKFLSEYPLVKNFLVQSATAQKLWDESGLWECPEGFTEYQDSCVQDEPKAE